MIHDNESKGADPRLVVAGDFIVLRMALVDALDGNFEAAILFQRLVWRCERTGEWAASRAELEAETRLSERKVKGAVKKLRDMGWITSRRQSSYDPTPVWSIVWQGGDLDHSSRVESVPHVKDETSRTVKDETSRTSYKTEDTPPIVPQGTERPAKSVDADPGFVEFWSRYPKKVDKKQARKAWTSEVVKPKVPAETVMAALAQYLKSRPKDKQYVKNPATWLRATEFAEAAAPAQPQPVTENDLRRKVNQWRM